MRQSTGNGPTRDREDLRGAGDPTPRGGTPQLVLMVIPNALSTVAAGVNQPMAGLLSCLATTIPYALAYPPVCNWYTGPPLSPAENA